MTKIVFFVCELKSVPSEKLLKSFLVCFSQNCIIRLWAGNKRTGEQPGSRSEKTSVSRNTFSINGEMVTELNSWINYVHLTKVKFICITQFLSVWFLINSKYLWDRKKDAISNVEKNFFPLNMENSVMWYCAIQITTFSNNHHTHDCVLLVVVLLFLMSLSKTSEWISPCILFVHC